MVPHHMAGQVTLLTDMRNMFKNKVESKYQIVAGFFSWLCPYCNFPILAHGYSQDANKAWYAAIQIEKHGKNKGLYDGYGRIGNMDMYVFSYLEGKMQLIKEDKLEDNWNQMQSKGIDKGKIKIYHADCYEAAGRPSYALAKLSKTDPNQERSFTITALSRRGGTDACPRQQQGGSW